MPNNNELNKRLRVLTEKLGRFVDIYERALKVASRYDEMGQPKPPHMDKQLREMSEDISETEDEIEMVEELRRQDIS
jgi:hypothetical protein